MIRSRKRRTLAADAACPRITDRPYCGDRVSPSQIFSREFPGKFCRPKRGADVTSHFSTPHRRADTIQKRSRVMAILRQVALSEESAGSMVERDAKFRVTCSRRASGVRMCISVPNHSGVRAAILAVSPRRRNLWPVANDQSKPPSSPSPPRKRQELYPT